MIVVTGATGQFGRQVVEGLLARMPAAEVGVSVRDPAKAADLAQRGLRVVRGDFAEPGGLAAAFAEAEQVLLVSVNSVGDGAVRMHGDAIRAARKAGVKRILYTSHQGASAASAVAFGRDHWATEELLRESGVAFVALRNGFYAESALYQLGGLKETGRVTLPGDGPVSWTTRADLAEAAVAALVEPGLFEDGVSPPLTAGEALRFADVARMASELLGREVTRVVVSDEAFRAGELARGVLEGFVGMKESFYRAVRAGEFDVVDPTLERVLGRRPLPFRETLRAFLGEWRD